jgi:hypothetical protein
MQGKVQPNMQNFGLIMPSFKEINDLQTLISENSAIGTIFAFSLSLSLSLSNLKHYLKTNNNIILHALRGEDFFIQIYPHKNNCGDRFFLSFEYYISKIVIILILYAILTYKYILNVPLFKHICRVARKILGFSTAKAFGKTLLFQSYTLEKTKYWIHFLDWPNTIYLNLDCTPMVELIRGYQTLVPSYFPILYPLLRCLKVQSLIHYFIFMIVPMRRRKKLKKISF